MKEHSLLDDLRVSFGVLIVLLAAVVALWFFVPYHLGKSLPSLQDRGLYGDSFGAVNALFTGLAFAGLIFTILLQQREIRLQRADFYAQLEEMRLSRDEVARQVQVQTLQMKVALADLKAKALETEIAAIEMESFQWVEAARADKSAPKIRQIKKQMDQITDALEKEIKA